MSLSETIDTLYKRAVLCGLSNEEFYSLTIPELNMHSEMYEEKRKQQQIYLLDQAMYIAQFVLNEKAGELYTEYVDGILGKKQNKAYIEHLYDLAERRGLKTPRTINIIN